MWSVGVSKIDGLTPEKQIRLHDGQIVSCDKFIEEISHFYDSISFKTPLSLTLRLQKSVEIELQQLGLLLL